jgi:hypothetical protein
MVTEHRYVLVLDTGRDYVRIFRADSPARPAGAPFWEGDGLHRTYEAMKRINRERRPLECHHLCRDDGQGRKPLFRIFKELPGAGWKHVSTHATRTDAAEAKKRAEQRTKDLARSAEAALLRKLERVGVVRKKVPKLTAKDLRYLEWMDSRAELFKDAA